MSGIGPLVATLYKTGKFILKREDGIVSIYLNFNDIKDADPDLSSFLLDSPIQSLLEMENSAKEFIRDAEIIKVRVFNLPEVLRINEIKSKSLDRLIAVRGIILRAFKIKPMVIDGAFICQECQEITHQEQRSQFLTFPTQCQNCRGRRTTFVFSPQESSFIDSQDITIQELPENVPAGQLPKTMDVFILYDLVDNARAGDIVTLVGILKVKQKSKTSSEKTFMPYIEGNSLKVETKEALEVSLTDKDVEEIKELAKAPNIVERILKSIAPRIFGWEEIKEAIGYVLIGGVRREYEQNIVRGEINCLLVGDPGTAKSQLLTATAKLAPRGVFCSGKGTSAAGLTAAVVKYGDEWALEAGAMVLSDRGICCIDEMDKMNSDDRVAIHEAMEQGFVSVNKAGINTRLNARAGVLGAANPTMGRYEPEKKVTENIMFPTTLLTRFDLIFVMKDQPEKEKDTEISERILGIIPDSNEILSSEKLRKYIAFARRINPEITDEAKKKIRDIYLDIRSGGASPDSPTMITARFLESMRRIAEAHARIRLSEKVELEDAEAAIRIVQSSLGNIGIDPVKGTLNVIQRIEHATQITKIGIAKELLYKNQTDTGLEKTKWRSLMIQAGIEEKYIDGIIKNLSERGEILEHSRNVFHTV